MNFIDTYDAGVKNQYATVGGVSVSYDDAGNLTADHRGYLYEYDDENRLERIYEMDGQNEVDIANYTYDALGRRIMVEDPIADTSTTYYYDGWRVLSEFEADTSSTPGPTIQRDFTWGNYLDEALVITVDGTTDHYYAHNHLYSPVALIDSAGAIEEYYEYDAYGQMTVYTDDGADNTWLTSDDTTDTTSAQGNPIAFTGQRLDSLDGGDFGIMYYKNRYYDVEVGRWLTRDPMEYVDGMSLYEYVGSEPLKYTDMFGLQYSGFSGSECIDSEICNFGSSIMEFFFGGKSTDCQETTNCITVNAEWSPGNNGVGGCLGGGIRTATCWMVPIEDHPTPLSLAGIDFGASVTPIPVIDPYMRLTTGETCAGFYADPSDALFDLALDIVPIGIDCCALKCRPSPSVRSFNCLDDQVTYLCDNVPGLNRQQATALCEEVYKRNSSFTIGGSRVRGDYKGCSDIDIGYCNIPKNKSQKINKKISKCGPLKVDKTPIVPGHSSPTIQPPISSPEEFFQRCGKSGNRYYYPSGSITSYPDYSIKYMPPFNFLPYSPMSPPWLFVPTTQFIE